MSAFAAAVIDRRATAAPDLRVERIIAVLRFLAAGVIFLFGQSLPNVGVVFVEVLGIFCVGYGALIVLAWRRVRTSSDREQTARFTLAADISLVGFALLVFSPDPGWTVYGCGLLVIASGGLRFRNGALLAAASLSLTYVVIMVWRASTLGMALTATQVVVHLGGYVIAGVLLNALLPELDELRDRQHDVYEPILRAEEEAGDALLMTEAGRPVYWNKAFEALTGYGARDLARVGASEIVTFDGDPPEAERGPIRARVRAHDGRSIDVDVIRRAARSDDRDRRVWILRDATVRERVEAELRDRALHDPLTGLPNRALLEDRLKSAIAVAQRQFTALSVLLLDLDGFKRINDEWGHHAGDLVLVEIASRLRDALRESDTAARLGGDEFVLVLPATPLVGALETARALVQLIAQPIEIDGHARTVGASIGIAVSPDQGRDAESMLAAADRAMYEAKHAGGGYRAAASMQP